MNVTAQNMKEIQKCFWCQILFLTGARYVDEKEMANHNKHWL